MKLAGVVVLYNPEETVISNINSYLLDVDILYVVDNSYHINLKLIRTLQQISKIRYINNNGNKGIAYAQNVAAREAIKDKYQWLLTMDQDSYATKNSIIMIRDFIEANNTDKIGIISAFQETENNKSKYHTTFFRKVSWVISSGNAINLNLYKKIGGFQSKLFIDAVDYEYCLRLKVNGYSIYIINKAIIKHSLGEAKKVGNQYINIHHYKRMYYRVRNTFYIRKAYKDKCPELSKKIFDMSSATWKTDILYGKHKIRQVLYMCWGYIDFLRNNFNKCLN